MNPCPRVDDQILVMVFQLFELRENLTLGDG